MGTEPFVGGYPAPVSTGASGVWSAKSVQLYSGSTAWPQPTKGFWTFIGDADNTSSGGANDLYSEGGLFQTAAQVSAGNNEYYVIGRWTNQSGMTGSGVGIIKGLRISGSDAPTGTIGVSKYYNWSLSNGISFGYGDVFVENAGGPVHFIVSAGYTGGSYQYSHSRTVKLNDSEAEQVSFSLRTSNGGPHGIKNPILIKWNNQLMQIAHGHEYQNGAYKKQILVTQLNQSTLDRSTPASRIYHSAWGYTAYQMTGKIIASHKTDASGNTINVTYDGYHQTPAGGSGNNVIMVNQWTNDTSNISYNHSNDYFIYNNSSSKDFYLTDTETDGDVFYISGYGNADSVVSSTRNFSAIMKRTYQASSLGDNGTWVLKFQTGGYNASTHITSLALDSSNNKLYFHGYADSLAGIVDNSVFIGRIDITNPTWVLDWCNCYSNEGFSAYPGWGRNKLLLTANDTITSFGYTQTTEGGGVNPVVGSIITVPRDGSSKGGAGTVDGRSVTSHDISGACLFQYHTASTNVTIADSNSGPEINMTGSQEYSNPTQGTTNFNDTDPSPVLYKNGGV